MSKSKPDTPNEFYWCSNCDCKFALFSNQSPNYCPNCGKASNE